MSNILQEQIDFLEQDRKEMEQVINDLLFIAEEFAPVYVCNNCERYTKEGYKCVHCGTDNSE